MGLHKTIDLEVELLIDFVDEDYYQEVAKWVSIFNTYFTFEVVSDNLATQLAGRSKENDKIHKSRKNSVQIFNNTMIKKLENGAYNVSEGMKPYQKDIEQFSYLKQNLSPKEIQKISDDYCQLKKIPPEQKKALEHSMFFFLTLNIEACHDALQAIMDYSNPLAQMMIDKAIARYHAVNELILNNNQYLALDKLLELGNNTILVIPTYCYFILMLDKIYYDRKLLSLVDGEFLSKIISNASKLIRITNDIGGSLVTFNENQIDSLTQLFLSRYENGSYNIQTFKDKKSLTRILKDNSHGEFNIVLDNIRDATDIPEAISTFCENIKYYSRVYQEERQKLLEDLKCLDKQLSDSKLSYIILGYVTFHEKLYKKNFENEKGEYAVASLNYTTPYLQTPNDNQGNQTPSCSSL